MIFCVRSAWPDSPSGTVIRQTLTSPSDRVLSRIDDCPFSTWHTRLCKCVCIRNVSVNAAWGTNTLARTHGGVSVTPTWSYFHEVWSGTPTRVDFCPDIDISGGLVSVGLLSGAGAGGLCHPTNFRHLTCRWDSAGHHNLRHKQENIDRSDRQDFLLLFSWLTFAVHCCKTFLYVVCENSPILLKKNWYTTYTTRATRNRHNKDIPFPSPLTCMSPTDTMCQ